MIISISIKNLALIDSVTFEPKNGLNVLSGETGAGKSLLIGSLNFVLGQRLAKTLVRHGCDFAFVEVVFESDNKEVLGYIAELGIECEEYIIISRKLHSGGRSECRINGRTVNLSDFKRLLPMLIDIYSQGEQLTLTDDSFHIKILDNSSEQVQVALAKYQEIYLKYCKIQKELAELGDAAAREREADILRYQIEEIQAANINGEEEEQLLGQRKRLINAKMIAESLHFALSALDEESIPSINSALSSLQKIADFDNTLAEVIERLDNASIELKDLLFTLKDKSALQEDIDLDTIQKRIEFIRDIKRKYGGSFQSVDKFLDNGIKRLEVLENAQAIEDKLVKEQKKAYEELEKVAKKLTSSRKQAAEMLKQGIIENLADLQMKGTQFEVQFTPIDFGSNGGEDVLFLLSPNPGQPLYPLSQIASGGEMSRIMLALKSIIADCEDTQTLVFDEIDAGISGSAAWTVAEKLYNLSKSKQVIAVTHLAQITAMADEHYLIQKNVVGDSTVTEITNLSSEQSLAEIMRLAGSDKDSSIGRLNAMEIKAQADGYKQNS